MDREKRDGVAFAIAALFTAVVFVGGALVMVLGVILAVLRAFGA